MLLIALLKLLDKKSKRKIEGSVHLLYLPLTFGLRKYIGCFVSLCAYLCNIIFFCTGIPVR